MRRFRKKMYREECEKSGSEEAKRRYRELSMMYLDEKPYTVQEISEVENISDTVHTNTREKSSIRMFTGGAWTI